MTGWELILCNIQCPGATTADQTEPIVCFRDNDIIATFPTRVIEKSAYMSWVLIVGGETDDPS